MTTGTQSAIQQDEDAGQRQLQEQMLEARMERIDRKILVLSGKGGVGKSTVAVNLAVSLARSGLKVGLLDVDLHGPSIPKMLGLEGKQLSPSADGSIEPIQVSENLSVVSVGLLLKSLEDPIIWRGPMKYSVIRQFLAEVNWGRLDCLVIDSPPGTGDEPLAVAQMSGQGAWAVVVTTPQEVALADVRRSISFCYRMMLPIAGLVENMSGMVCTKCGEIVPLFGSGGGEALASATKVNFLGRIPLSSNVAASGDRGQPLATADEAADPAAQAFAQMVENLRGRLNLKLPTAADAPKPRT